MGIKAGWPINILEKKDLVTETLLGSDLSCLLPPQPWIPLHPCHPFMQQLHRLPLIFPVEIKIDLHSGPSTNSPIHICATPFIPVRLLHPRPDSPLHLSHHRDLHHRPQKHHLNLVSYMLDTSQWFHLRVFTCLPSCLALRKVPFSKTCGCHV